MRGIERPSIIKQHVDPIQLIHEAYSDHKSGFTHARLSLEKRKEAGAKLNRAKEACLHAGLPWLDTLRKVFRDTEERVAQKYMRLEKFWDKISSSSEFRSDMGLTEALNLLKPTKMETEAEEPACDERDEPEHAPLRPAQTDETEDELDEESPSPTRKKGHSTPKVFASDLGDVAATAWDKINESSLNRIIAEASGKHKYFPLDPSVNGVFNILKETLGESKKRNMDFVQKLRAAFEEIVSEIEKGEKRSKQSESLIPPGKIGLLRADEAINVLIKIPKNDPSRKEGLQKVALWAKRNS